MNLLPLEHQPGHHHSRTRRHDASLDLRDTLVFALAFMVGLATAGCGRERFAEDLDRILRKENLSTVGVIGTFHGPAMSCSRSASDYLTSYLAHMGEARYTVIRTDSAKAQRLADLVMAKPEDYLDPAHIAKMGRALRLKAAVLATSTDSTSEELAVKVVNSDTDELYLAGTLSLGDERYGVSGGNNVVDQNIFQTEELDFKKFYIGHMELGDGTTVPITLDITAVEPLVAEETSVTCTLNSSDSRQDFAGQINRGDNIVRLPILGTGIVYVNSDWKVVFESTRDHPYWVLTEEGTQ